MKRQIKTLAVFLFVLLLVSGTLFTLSQPTKAEEEAASGNIDEIIAAMTPDEKISQMIIPAIRSWNGSNVTDLSAVPDLADALKKHQYGGVILFGQNITETEQAARLISALQSNNATIDASTNIPYFLPVDAEGGIVQRLSFGTRMTGNMAIGATGENDETNALESGRIIGSEISALGFNINCAPDIDVNSNPNNPVIGTRSFSDDPDTVSKLGIAYSNGLAEKQIIPTYKHFPGHGDTGTDSHIGTATVDKTYEELKKTELVPFEAAIEGGAEMIMTAHITLPKYDDEQTFADGSTGFYPATMSEKVLTNLLREELGYNGIVITDALEMDAIQKAKLVPGTPGSAEYSANIAEKCINAGVDILLLPTDMINEERVTFYDDYIDLLINKIQSGSISEDRINESVKRILQIKDKYGILDLDTSGSNIEEVVANAKSIVGSVENHTTEMQIAKEAVTLVRNEDLTLPASGYKKKIVFVGRQSGDEIAINFAVNWLIEEGLIEQNAYIDNLASGKTSGQPSSDTKITIDYSYDTANAALHYTENLNEAVNDADLVIGISKTSSLSALKKANAQYQAIQNIMDDTHNAGGKYILISDNLPYDAARYQDADAILLAYMGTGLNTDPTERSTDSNIKAYNANVVAALLQIFDEGRPTGTLPVRIPTIEEDDDGNLSYTDTEMYSRGFGLEYTYKFTSGMDSTYRKDSSVERLSFSNNARFNKLTEIQIDGQTVDSSNYTVTQGSTNIDLPASYLKTLSAGAHTLTAVHTYDEGTVRTETTFYIQEAETTTEETTTEETTTEETTTEESTTAETTTEESTTAETTTEESTTEGTTTAETTAAPTTTRHMVTTTMPTTTDKSPSPKTGDAANLTLWIALIILAAAAAGSAVIVGRRRRNR